MYCGRAAFAGRTRKDIEKILSRRVLLDGDAALALTLVVAPPYRSGRVEVLEKGLWKPLAAAWKGDRLSISADLRLYDCLAVKIRRQ